MVEKFWVGKSQMIVSSSLQHTVPGEQDLQFGNCCVEVDVPHT